MSEIIIMGRRASGQIVHATEEEIINNALQQEREGIAPRYSFYDYKKKEKVTPAGWLVWSLYDGCGVVYRRADGKMVIVKGVQGDFVCG